LEHNSLYYCIEDVSPNHWDPLDISDAVWPHNKYEMYIPAVFTRALNALGSEEFVQFLSDLALKEFGVKENKVKDERAWELILAVRDYYFRNLI
jgi:hypothetical protein